MSEELRQQIANAVDYFLHCYLHYRSQGLEQQDAMDAATVAVFPNKRKK